jgi:peptidoglycan hydrolase-like protein with peptidoglycan-binding domain
MTSPRRIVLAGMGLVLVVVIAVVIVSDPFAGAKKPSGVADNAAGTSLATVTRRPLSSQTPVSGTLGYASASSIRIPSGTPPSAVQQAEQSVAASEAMLQSARASLSGEAATLAGLQATLSAAREKESVDCAGDGAAESAFTGSSSADEGGSSPGGASSGLCTGDVETVSSYQQGASTDETKVAVDRTSVSSAQAALARTQAGVSAARSSEEVYGQSSTFTMLPAVGRVVSRGQSLYAIDHQPVVLLYGSVLPSRAFVAGMPAGPEVAELNANLDALGYASGLTGDVFTAATATAIEEFQEAHGIAATGALPLGSVVFERGPVLVTSVTATIGANVTPGPVLGVSSTMPQVTIQLSAAQQSSVKVGDPVTITLPTEGSTAGVVSSVGAVAKAPSKGGEDGGGEGGEEGGPTIEVDVTPSDPGAIGHLDEAPVTVAITTASVPAALTVPVDALLALAGGGYALEVVEGHAHRLEAVSLGLFDDAEGLVQVSGREVAAGQRVVVPAS